METQNAFAKDLQDLKDEITEKLNNEYYHLDKRKKLAEDYKQIMTDYREALEQGKAIEILLGGMKIIS